jgi:hypothetical protein
MPITLLLQLIDHLAKRAPTTAPRQQIFNSGDLSTHATPALAHECPCGEARARKASLT